MGGQHFQHARSESLQRLGGFVFAAFARGAGIQRRKINLSQVFAGQKVGVKQTADHIWLVSFMTIMTWDISTTRRAGWNRSRIRSDRNCYPSARNELTPIRSEWNLESMTVAAGSAY